MGDQLKLPTIAKESLVIKTFGNDEIYRKETCEKVKFTVGDIGGHFATKMEAYVVPDICAPISNQEIDRAKRCYAHLKKIDLADSNHGNEEMEIQLLIRVDYMWSFFTGEIARGEDEIGPVAGKTSLGWVLSGPISTTKKQKLSNVNFVSAHVLKIAGNCQEKPTAE